jgi:YtfJ family uncharacterized protein
MRGALLALLCLLALPAAALQKGESLPPLAIERLGEILVEGDDTRYTPWDSAGLDGQRVQVLQYLAARTSARALNKPFTDRLERSGIPLDRYHVTTIVNLDDALFGTRGFVISELEKNKRRYHRSTIVADEAGQGLGAWRLGKGSSAIIILGADARVLFFREGAMSEAEIEEALEMVRAGDSTAAAGGATQETR